MNALVYIGKNILGSGSSDNNIVIWELKKGIVLRTLKGHNDIVWDLVKLNNYLLGSCSTDGRILIWDWNSGY